MGSKFHRRATEEPELGRGKGTALEGEQGTSQGDPPTCLISGQSPSQRRSQTQLGTSPGQFLENINADCTKAPLHNCILNVKLKCEYFGQDCDLEI